VWLDEANAMAEWWDYAAFAEHDLSDYSQRAREDFQRELS